MCSSMSHMREGMSEFRGNAPIGWDPSYHSVISRPYGFISTVKFVITSLNYASPGH